MIKILFIEMKKSPISCICNLISTRFDILLVLWMVRITTHWFRLRTAILTFCHCPPLCDSLMWVLSSGVSARGYYLKARCLCGASAHISGETGQRGYWQFGLLGTGSVHAKRCYYYQTRSRCRPLHVNARWQWSDCGRQTVLLSTVWNLNVPQ